MFHKHTIIPNKIYFSEKQLDCIINGIYFIRKRKNGKYFAYNM